MYTTSRTRTRRSSNPANKIFIFMLVFFIIAATIAGISFHHFSESCQSKGGQTSFKLSFTSQNGWNALCRTSDGSIIDIW